MGFDLTSNSWSGSSYSQALVDAINGGCLFVAAAGNNGDLDNDIYPRYPATYDLENILSVAVTDSNDILASFSHYGATSVDLAEP
ncbi:MAG: Subtilisin DY [Firmicutes bacterium ADurb.Bin419]|nr:MAG: Subtilisin DY [Firmicutes bacterium ADurb.Bin419]